MLSSSLLVPGLLWPLFLGISIADRQYLTRPDLSPPRLNITIPASGTSPGYIFIGPYSGFMRDDGLEGPEQQAGYILRDDGDLIWSSLGFLSGWVGNLQVREWQGEPVITGFQGTLDSMHGHGFGHPSILNQNYETIRDVHGGDHKIISIHEFNVLQEGTALVEIYQPTAMDLSLYGGGEDSVWIVDAVFQELDLSTGNLLFQWSSLEHVDPSESNVSLSSGNAGDGASPVNAWDYMHINSVDKDSEGNYLVSGRHTSAIFKVDGRTGAIIWQVGGKSSDFDLGHDVLFGFQHDARFVSRASVVPGAAAEEEEEEEEEEGVECISLFDNGARAIHGHRGDSGAGPTLVHDRSRAKVLCLDTKNWTASVVVSLEAPRTHRDEPALLAPSQGNVQILPNSHIFVNWGQAGAVTEYDARGEAIFHAHLDSGELGKGVQSYRGFRFPWHGFPLEVPAIVALVDDDGDGTTTRVYVSWNGDTETAQWRFRRVSRSCVAAWGMDDEALCRSVDLGEVDRTHFETCLVVAREKREGGYYWTSPEDDDDYDDTGYYAQAVDKYGLVIVTTSVVAGQREVPSGATKAHLSAHDQLLKQQESMELK